MVTDRTSARQFHDKFVAKKQWIDEQVVRYLPRVLVFCNARKLTLPSFQYQELFSVAQALSGPGSTKMHYCINLIHDGFASAVLGFLMWR